ncbi:Chaoptin [Nymphon striatum]|nr:Chaoptin [Nymphon striatum]
MTEVSGHFFGNTTIGEVILYAPKLFKVDSDAFAGQENSLYEVSFSDSDLTEVPAESINILSRLKSFSYSFTAETKAIRGSIFKNQVNKKSVETLDFNTNGIESIEPGAFTPLTNLKSVSFYKNPLKTIDPTSFPPAPNRIIDLSIQKGALETIPRMVIESFQSYTFVSLTDNKIKTLAKEDITLLIKKKIFIDLQGMDVELIHRVHLNLANCLDIFIENRGKYIENVILVFLFQIEKIACEECPSTLKIIPCSCIPMISGLKVECPDTEIEKLLSALDIFSTNKMHIDLMYIDSMTMKEITGHFFGNSTIGKVEFYAPSLSKVNSDAFEGQENSLHDVSFTDSNLTEVPAESINILARLKSFTYSFTAETKAIRGSIFKNQVNKQSVETLSFGFSGIESIEPGAFALLTNLKSVSFYDNPLKTIDPSSFPPAPNQIIDLQLKKGALEAIPRKVLESLQAYTLVNLENNKIKTLEKEDITVLIKNKLYIKLDGNELNCDCNFLLFAKASQKLWSGTCAMPKQRFNISLNQLETKDFPNCPKDL